MIANIDKITKIEIKQALDFTCALFGILFKLYKFRSMSDARDKDGNLLPDEEGLGKFRRALWAEERMRAGEKREHSESITASA